MTYLLLISCSQRKLTTSAPLPAIERYDGPVYRCLRKYRDTFDGFPDNLDILILSAKYGLITLDGHIANYDCKMTDERADAISAKVQEELNKYLRMHSYFAGSIDEVFINLGKTYMQTIEGFHWHTIRTLEASGGIGQRTQQMKTWLHRIAEDPHTP